jgi:hypothetical protein
MKPYHLWFFFRFKMTINCFTDIFAQTFQIIGFGKNRFAERTRRLAAFDSIFH